MINTFASQKARKVKFLSCVRVCVFLFCRFLIFCMVWTENIEVKSLRMKFMMEIVDKHIFVDYLYYLMVLHLWLPYVKFILRGLKKGPILYICFRPPISLSRPCMNGESLRAIFAKEGTVFFCWLLFSVVFLNPKEELYLTGKRFSDGK